MLRSGRESVGWGSDWAEGPGRSLDRSGVRAGRARVGPRPAWKAGLGLGEVGKRAGRLVRPGLFRGQSLQILSGVAFAVSGAPAGV